MKRGLLLFALLLGVAGCASGQMVVAPEGYPVMVGPPGYGTLMIHCN